MLAKLSVDQALMKAKSYAKKGEVAEAEKIYLSILKNFSKNQRALKGLASLNHVKGKNDSKGLPQEIINELLKLLNKGDSSSVFHRSQILTKQYPDSFILWNIFGVSAAQLNKFEKAIDAFKKSISLKPDYAEAYNNLGNVLKDQGKLDEAINAYKNSISINPNRAETYSNRGTIFYNQGKLNEAMESYKQSILLNPNYAEAHINLSCTLFNYGKYQEALNEYEWRWRTNQFLPQIRRFSQPQWNKNTSLNGKTILIWSEQGVGDTITWSSCLSYISSQAEHCILECQEKIVPLLKRSFPNIDVKAEDRSRDKERDDFDFHLPMGSLYKNLSEEILQKTKVNSYLIPNQERVDYWKKRLNSLGNGPYIGVSWKSALMTLDRIPNYASISEWSSLLTLPNIKFINLQPTEFEDYLKKIKHELGVTVHNFEEIDHWNNLDDVAALCTALDMVVSTKITVPLIAAGVGTSTKLANWKQSSWNNILLNPRGPLVQIYERNTWETWENVFISISDDILKLKDFKYQKENKGLIYE